jgi:hypothetical protein
MIAHKKVNKIDIIKYKIIEELVMDFKMRKK